MSASLLQPAHETRRDHVLPGLLRVVGSDRNVARLVAEGTGDAINVVTRPFVTIGFVAADQRAFAVVLHSLDRDGRLQISADTTFVPWTPAIPRAIADVAFRQLGATELVMRADADDVERAVVASRFGFTLTGYDGESVILRLRRGLLRPALARRVRRHLH